MKSYHSKTYPVEQSLRVVVLKKRKKNEPFFWKVDESVLRLLSLISQTLI